MVSQGFRRVPPHHPRTQPWQWQPEQPRGIRERVGTQGKLRLWRIGDHKEKLIGSFSRGKLLGATLRSTREMLFEPLDRVPRLGVVGLQTDLGPMHRLRCDVQTNHLGENLRHQFPVCIDGGSFLHNFAVVAIQHSGVFMAHLLCGEGGVSVLG